MELKFNSTSNSTAMGSERIAPAVVLGLCCLVGLPCNIAVIISIAREWNRNLSFTLKLMINLAVSDALTLCLVSFVLYGILFGWNLGLWSCKFLYFLMYWSLYVGVLTVTSMSVHRYHNVIKSRVTNRMILQRLERRHRCLQLIAIWILAFAFALPIYFVQGLGSDKDGLKTCTRTVMKSQSVKVTVLLFEILLGFIIPFLTMLTCYLWLHKGLSQKAKNSGVTTAPQDQEPRNQGTKVRTYKKRLVIRIVVAFFVFWTPVHIINVIDIVTILTETSHPDVHSQLKSFRRVYSDTSKTLALLNCCLNPFLYAMSSGNLMKCFRKR
ncbi:Atypical chemokine receptor 3 [Labeo rohita]|uniref:Atypical chemokine receptor 3 n=2 Tax=Labeo rohita TaxID=84645 RepID=A0ABQ8LSF9_LABRO|nr:Atypical chemokine receptor 3 [Labeo rohita]